MDAKGQQMVYLFGTSLKTKFKTIKNRTKLAFNETVQFLFYLYLSKHNIFSVSPCTSILLSSHLSFTSVFFSEPGTNVLSLFKISLKNMSVFFLNLGNRFVNLIVVLATV